MTSDFPNSPGLPSEQFDTGPLSWVMADIREAITHAGKLLKDALVQDAETQSTTLLHAKSYLHQAHGALQMVDIDGVSIVTETIEGLLEQLQSGQLKIDEHHIDVILEAFHAVLRYLEDLLSGVPNQPVRLFPYYRALLEMSGAERIHPADLFFPTLSVREKIPELSVNHPATVSSYASIRQQFEKLLLKILTSKDAQQQQLAAQAMHDLLYEIDLAQTNAQAKAFWVVMRAFVEAVAKGGIGNQQYVKQILGRVNLQIRRLVDGVHTIPERLLRDALFFLAQVETPSPLVASVRQAYQLENTIPADYQQKNYGQIAAGVLTTAKEQLTAVKNLWARIANGEQGLADKFSQKMKDLAETGAELNSSALAKLLRELSGIARHVVHSEDGARLGLELATSLLFVENALDQITRLPAHFSERAEEITSRLLSVVSGDEPQSQAEWMGEISREAQQRQTMSVLVSEMQTSLRQVEKILDDYFRDPTHIESLHSVDGVLHQIAGALAILDQDTAMQAVEHTRTMVGKFTNPSEEAASFADDYKTVAQNIGALSFFIETLQSQPESAKKKFSFDPQEGIFHSNLLEVPAQKELLPGATESGSLDDAVNDNTHPLTTEQELVNQQQQSMRLAASLAVNPDDTTLQAQLKDSLESERSVATLLDDVDAGDRANAAIELLNQGDTVHSAENLQHLVSTHVEAPAEPVVKALPQTDEAIDAELLEIFLTEADEVLSFVQDTLPLSRQDVENQDYLTSLRRSFHTLKGSSRMVGLHTFGEAAWNVEQVMNLWLSESRSGNDDLYALLDRASMEMVIWVEELKQHTNSNRTGAAIIAGAQRLKAGLSPDEASAEQEQNVIPDVVTPAAPEIHDFAAASASFAEENSSHLAEPDSSASANTATDSDHETSALELSAFDDLPSASTLLGESELTSKPASAMSELDELAAQLSMLNIGAELAPELSVTELIPESDTDIAAVVAQTEMATDAGCQSEDTQDTSFAGEIAAAVDPVTASTDVAESIASGPVDTVVHTEADMTAGTEANRSEPEVPEVENSSATIIEFPDLSKPAISVDDNIKRIGDLEISLPLYSIYMAETDEIVRFLSQDFAEWRHEPYRPVSTHAIHASHTLAGSSATVGLKPLQELAHSLELVLQRLERHPVVLQSTEFDVLDRALDMSKRMLQKFALSEMAESAPEEMRLLEKLLEDVIARSDAGADEEFITSTNEKLDLNDLSGWPDNSQENLSSDATAMVSANQAPQAPVSRAEDPDLQIKDELDQDLLPVFLEEGNDLLPMVGQLLRSWQEQPEDVAIPQSVARLMHTIKGSARMAGAMQLGQYIHDMETRIENLMHAGSAVRQPLLEDLLARHDHSMSMFDRLQYPDAYTDVISELPLTAAQELDQFQETMAANQLAISPAVQEQVLRDTEPAQPDMDTRAVAASPIPAPLPATSLAAPVSTAPVPLVRVRADILDRLVNQAGEVSISRSRLENEVDTLRSSLSELTENVNRLRDQLREVEIQAETQITSRMAHSADREFDPLEFDRFTRLQELTRMMAESVSDVATVQNNLTRTIDGASGNLHLQARLTRELQQDLMRVRMIPFASVSERLYRVTRQAAKETDKRVNLDIRGANIEMDRGVLEKMVGPFEHLLRNAVVHGIETREQRQQHGKNETGELLIEIRQEGNEVVIRFSDDGQGLDLNSIRQKARSTGLIGMDDHPGEAETARMIFEAGFSTVAEVTELAGRGVGMDVVRSEAASLGGRVEVATSEGKGAEFTIHLPLTLAVTQVVLLSSGGKTYAVPSVLVEQVQHLKANSLVSAYNDGVVIWQGQRVAMHYLSGLLGHADAVPIAQQYTPLLIMKSGIERVALHVDEIIGNREVVVKNIGPQLSRMAGIAGATVLGSGDVVLILNPVPLMQRYNHERTRVSQTGLTPMNEFGSVADLHPQTDSDAAQSEPVQGLRTQHTVMVVDDSLTVRRVTQRLLTREGYQVILAKDGIDALEQLQSVTPDIMLVDIEMPRMDGFDLTRNVRSDSRTSHIPIIMITSRTADKHRNYAYELGVNEYFGKPYREDDLLSAIVNFVSKDKALVV